MGREGISTEARVHNQIIGYRAKRLRRRRWHRIFSALACLVVFCTTYALILPALTMENQRVLDCPYAVHTHTPDCYDAEGRLICGQADFVIHTHDESCYDAGGYLVCPLPEIEAHAHTDACFEQVPVLACGVDAEDHAHTDDCYRLETALICGRREAVLHTHTEACCGADGALICGQPQVLEHIHTDECFRALEDGASAGTYTYEDDAVAVEVTLAEGSAVPGGAELSVRPITDGDEGYDYASLVRQAEEAMARAAAEIALYDISFFTPGGEYLPVEDTATVSLQFKEPVLTASAAEVAVLHYQEEAGPPVPLEAVDVESGADDAVSALTFRTDGFSVFAVVTVTEGAYQKVTDVKELDGKSVAILSNSAKYSMTAKTNSGGFAAASVASTADLSGCTFWTFEKNTDGTDTYYISNNGNYLVMGAQTLSATTVQSRASAFTVTITNGQAVISASVNGTVYYINLFGGENSGNSGFKSWTESTSQQQQLYIKAEQTGGGTTPADLDGKSFVIANLNTAARQYAMRSTSSGSYLTAAPVSTIKGGETTYVTGEDLTPGRLPRQALTASIISRQTTMGNT